ncbi:hypothetical protein [Leucobacter massiliensis]|uniref:hypothetical protein n=1 Tax=Leucobacter massiliensis TaxID=1686285 RepID=UPI0011B2035A|nr:hypothetical protein [Leucobacter massiliensis]
MATQEAQLRGYIDQANAWGEEIVAQLPEADVEELSPNSGGTRQSSALYEDWPQYYYWEQRVRLKPEGARTPEQLADELQPWLEQQGWQRATAGELPAGKESFTRDYRRGGYSLAVEVFTEPPPRAQTISFRIVTPDTVTPDAGIPDDDAS